MINWGLGAGGGFQNALAQGLQFGTMMRQRNDEREYKSALAGYDPTKPETLKPIMQVDPRTGLQLQRYQAEAAQRQKDAQRQQLQDISRLFEGVTPENYGQRVAIAQRMGIDTAQVPQQYDPGWVEQNAQMFRFFAQKPEVLSGAGKQAVDMGYQPGTPQFNQVVQQIIEAEMSKPYVQGAETKLYTPRIGAPGQVQGGGTGPQPGTIEDGYRFKGGNPADPNAWEPVTGGGGASRVTGGFLDGL